MGGSRATRGDFERVARDILNPDVIVSDAEKRRCLTSVTTYNEMIKTWHQTEPCPSLGVACIAGHGWMEVYCPGCRSVKRIDLAWLNVHPQTRISAIAFRLRCTICQRKGPIIRGLYERPMETLAQQSQREFGEQTGGWEAHVKKPR